MTDNIYHKGLVDRIEGDNIFVKIVQQSACAGCHARSMCSAAESKVKMIEIADHSGAYHINEEVIICGRSSMGLQAVFFAFVIPLFIVVIAIIIGLYLQLGETVSGLTGLLFLIPYYFILYIIRDKIKKKFVFTLKKINNDTL